MKKKGWNKKNVVRLCGVCEECNKELLSNEGGWIITATKKYFCHDGKMVLVLTIIVNVN